MNMLTDDRRAKTMLNIYDNREEVPDIKIIDLNDSYFNLNTFLYDNEFTRTVLRVIDHAEYYSEYAFVSRTKGMGNLTKNMLSTGAKTLFNIYYHPDDCFNVCECGYSALSLLPLIENGNILWEYPATQFRGSVKECSIMFKGKIYKDFTELLRFFREYADGRAIW